jgi:hypothetical protein
MTILIAIIILWLVPIFVANSMGKAKRRTGILYGVFLGWLGVLILAVLPANPELTLEELERRKNAVAPQWYEQKKSELLASRTTRECPHCREQMRRDASVCPHCQRESQAWRLHEGRWWTQSGERWFWLDEIANEWLEAPRAIS